MTDQNQGMSCGLGSWLLAAGVGLLTTILLLVLGDYTWPAAIFLGLVLFGILGLLFNWLFCAPLPKPGEVSAARVGRAGNGSAAAGGAAAAGAAATAASGADASASASDSASDASAGDAAKAEAKPAETASGAAAEAAGAGGSGMKASAKLAGEEELASRKGSWKYEGDGAKAAKPAAAKATPAAETYDNEGANEPMPTDEAKEIGDLDGDGTLEGTDEGSKPQMLSEAREGGPDNLKEIKGIGPKLEKLCHSMGVFHFDQIASWGPQEVAWMDANLQGFRGRVTRDDWVGQAKILASGGETEFSKRVDDGDVY